MCVIPLGSRLRGNDKTASFVGWVEHVVRPPGMAGVRVMQEQLPANPTAQTTSLQCWVSFLNPTYDLDGRPGNVGFRSSTQPTSLIPSSFPRRRESMCVIPLGSRLRGNDGFVGWVERSETQQGTQFVGCVQTAGRRTEELARCWVSFLNPTYDKRLIPVPREPLPN